MSKKTVKTACITGATSGIGAAFAQKLAGLGFDLILTGRREDKIRRLARKIISETGVKVEVVIADLSREEIVDELAAKISKADNLEILVNNAGFAVRNFFHYENFSTHRDMLVVHVMAPLRLTHAALPGMVKRGKGAVINVSSTSSFTPFPKNAMYAATKCFLNLFSESLYLELKSTGVKVQVLCPGMTRTDFHERMGFKREDIYKDRGLLKAMEPEEVVEISLKCLKKDKPVCIPGFHNKLTAVLVGWLPRSILYRLLLFRRSRRRKKKAQQENS